MLTSLKAAAKRALAVPAIRKTYDATSRAILEVAGSSRIAATVYSLPGFLTFNREQYAILSGRRAYYRSLSKARRSHVELRRNIHRLEKGLLMEPRRAVFAKDYIEETLDFYRNAQAGGVIDPAELTWATSVLDAWVDAVDPSDPFIARIISTYHSIPRPTPEGELERALTPYPRKDSTPANVTYEDLLALARHRRSVRWFEDRPVGRELIDQAIIVGREAPTACNREPFEFMVFDDPEKVRTIASIPYGAGGYAEQIPTIVVVKGRFDSYFSPRDRHVPYIDSSLAAMQFMLALETLGLASSVINWPDFEPLEMKMQKTLRLAPHERVIFLMAVGHPRQDAHVAASVKKSLSVLRSFNAPTAP